jgi:hypothetical protein
MFVPPPGVTDPAEAIRLMKNQATAPVNYGWGSWGNPAAASGTASPGGGATAAASGPGIEPSFTPGAMRDDSQRGVNPGLVGSLLRGDSGGGGGTQPWSPAPGGTTPGLVNRLGDLAGSVNRLSTPPGPVALPPLVQAAVDRGEMSPQDAAARVAKNRGKVAGSWQTPGIVPGAPGQTPPGSGPRPRGPGRRPSGGMQSISEISSAGPAATSGGGMQFGNPNELTLPMPGDGRPTELPGGFEFGNPNELPLGLGGNAQIGNPQTLSAIRALLGGGGRGRMA